jgi:hypothetical protein
MTKPQAPGVLYATIEFWNTSGRKVCYKNRKFQDERHLNNWIAYMSRTHNLVCDEVYEY